MAEESELHRMVLASIKRLQEAKDNAKGWNELSNVGIGGGEDAELARWEIEKRKRLVQDLLGVGRDVMQ